MINMDFAKLNTKNLKIDSIGMYFGEHEGSQIRLSIEGSQLVGKYANKNIIEIDKSLAKLWMHGYDLELSAVKIPEDAHGFVIIKSGEDFLSCGRITAKEIANSLSAFSSPWLKRKFSKTAT